MNLMISKNLTNNEQNGPHKWSNGSHFPLDYLGDPLWSSLVAFLGVIEFFSSQSFQRC